MLFEQLGGKKIHRAEEIPIYTFGRASSKRSRRCSTGGRTGDHGDGAAALPRRRRDALRHTIEEHHIPT